MEKHQDAGCAIVVACTEIADFAKLKELIGHLWSVNDLRILTGPAPESVFTERGGGETRERLRVGMDALLRSQSTKRLAIVAHDGCTMNCVSHEEQMTMLRTSVGNLSAEHPDAKVAGIWVDTTGTPLKVDF